MPTIEEIHLGDIGTEFRCTIKDSGTAVDISSASSVKQIKFKKPDCTVVTKSATFYTDGTDGIISYVTVDGDLDIAGLWQAQAYVELTSGKYHSDIISFRVYDNLGTI